MRHIVSAAAILACVLGLAACSSSDMRAGSGSGGTGGTGGTGGSSMGASSGGKDDDGASGGSDDGGGSGSVAGRSSKTGSPLAGTDPCSLLQPADVPELNQDSLFKPTAASDGICSGYDYAVTIKDVSADVYDMEFNSSTVKALPDMAGHRAAMSQNQIVDTKSCVIVLEVTGDEVVDVTVMHDEDPAKTCDIAKKAAAIVAGRIPA
ncbi:DUF3558 domain-containing protein [Actinacidiphila bryophytorum]|uniref:DUF3558 domain-containing protein n=1 Tax=Actinacidiphila bryophytorum TaxID=1436133 RepID=UPI002176D967|nr:DUF3558 domain-containing protein [Actinacidiphila bryophytorum]UWE11188.1 DUF3558 domain-containing protein [Actinacidiphila bryophytorum]